MDQQPVPSKTSTPHPQQDSPPPKPQQDTQDSSQLTPEEARRELTQAIHGSNEVLVTATTAFKLFPDTLTLDRAKLTVTKRSFWKTGEVVSIRIEDVLNVTATVGPMLGAVKIVSRIMSADKPYTIGSFWRDDALRIKRITQGYVIALQRGIECNSLPTKELAVMLDKLGEDAH